MKIFLLAIFASINAFASNSIIAIINDEVITMNAVNSEMKLEFNSKQKLQVVNKYINNKLQLEKAAKLGIEPKDSAVKSALDNIATQNNLSAIQLQALPQFDTLVNDIKDSLVLNALKQIITKDVKVVVTESELNKAVKSNPGSGDLHSQIKIAQIAIASIDKTDSLVKSEEELIQDFLLELTGKIKAGESFSALAKLHSQDPSYKNGGISPWLDKQRLPDAFLNVVNKLKANEISEPFFAAKGWRILKVVDTRKVNKHIDAVKAALVRQKQNIYFKDWVKKLREEAYIEIFDHKL